MFITEGILKGDSAVSRGLCCVAVLGTPCWNVEDWKHVTLIGRDVYVAFDSDSMVNPNVQRDLSKFRTFLLGHGARVQLIYLPPGEGGGKVGLDDWFAAGHKPEELFGLAAKGLREIPPAQIKRTRAAETEDAEGAVIILTPASEVRIKNTKWAWKGRVPLEAISICAGEPGKGKSTITTEIAALATRGQLLGDLYGTPVTVAIASAEDNRASTIVPRLIAAGADRARIHFIDAQDRDGVERGIAIPNDLPLIETELRRVDARILVFDPIVAYLPDKVNSWRDQDVRRVLAPVSKMAERLGLAVICIIHLNKREVSDFLSRISGSVAFGAAARSVLAFVDDPTSSNPRDRVLAHPKCNVGPEAVALRYSIEGRTVQEPGSPVVFTSGVVWGQEASDIKTADLLVRMDPEDRSSLEEAMEWMRDFLKSGPRPAEAVFSEAKAAGIAKRTLERAKGRLGVRSRKVVGEWLWSLPLIYGGVGVLGSDPLQEDRFINNNTKTAKTAKNALYRDGGGVDHHPSSSGAPATNFGRDKAGVIAFIRSIVEPHGWQGVEVAGRLIGPGLESWEAFLDSADLDALDEAVDMVDFVGREPVHPEGGVS